MTRKEKQKAYYAKNSARINARQKKYREENKELIKAQGKKYREENKEFIKQSNLAWRARNPEKYLAMVRTSKQKQYWGNPDKYREYGRKHSMENREARVNSEAHAREMLKRRWRRDIDIPLGLVQAKQMQLKIQRLLNEQ